MKEKTRNYFVNCENTLARLLIIVVLILPVGSEIAFAQVSKNVSIKVGDVSVRTALDYLQKNTLMHFMYEEEAIPDNQRVTLEYENVPLSVVLDDLCKQASLRYEVKEGIVLLSPVDEPQIKTQTPSLTISGTVYDEQGERLIGVNIMVGGTTRGMITDMDGNYEIKVNQGDKLVFSYVGMEEVQVKVQQSKPKVDVEMKTHQTALGEVVVTGYQTLSKERATGAYTVISEKNTKGKLETNILSRIEGQIAGMNRVGYDGRSVVLRGVATYGGVSSPLYVVDGIPFEGDISSITPSDVQNITVLKDATAASIYGAKSANGVIVITTKRGQIGATRVSYSGSARITPKPDLNYLNMVNSSGLVDLQIEGFNYYHDDFDDLNRRSAINPVINILYQHERGEITDLEKALAPYRNSNNRRQIEKEFMRTGLTHQHNLSISGGTERNQYIASLNYTKEQSNQKNEYNDRIGFVIRNNTTLYKWLHADIGVSGSFSRIDNKNSTGNDYIYLLQAYPSYYMLRDAGGTPTFWQRGKSDYELERLRAMDLMDERYSPITEKGKEHLHANKNYYRIHAGLLFNIAKGISLDLKYQTEGTYNKQQTIYDAQSWMVKNMINEAAQYDNASNELLLNVPKGSQMDEYRGDIYSYTFRAQMNLDRSFGVHDVNAIAGAERRLMRSTGTRTYYMGYDESSLAYTPYNPMLLTEISDTEAVYGSFSWNSQTYNGQSYQEDRYISFYGNVSYTYDNRYSATGSIRIDKSDLYATDPKKQNRPLWSAGGSWHVTEERFMQHLKWINLLKVRATYGIGGNIPKMAGPYMNIRNEGYHYWVEAVGSSISNPPNPLLRWEKTATTNIGIDFSLFNYRLRGSINYYNRKTTDVLGSRNADPTLGWPTLLLNYGKMNNNGIEVELQSVNLQKRDFVWQTNVVVGYNKNKLTNLEGSRESVFDYTAYDVAAVGYPLNSIFSYRYAGLDPDNGNVLVYNKDGEKVSNVESIEDLVYSGTRTPKYTASLRNLLSFKNIDLSFMFVYYGGHVMRDVVSDYLTGAPQTNLNRKSLLHWRQPGDEKIPGMAPSISYIDTEIAQTWYSADVHVKKADYIKLRDVSLSYNVPKKWLSKYDIETLTLTCQIGNLWWWAKNGDIDPEAYEIAAYGTGGLTPPNPVTYTFGLSINF